MKKNILTSVCLLLMSGMIAYAGVDYDYEAKALDEMHILSGDGIDYNLNGKLKRSEAATFIVKVMGEQNNVLKNKTHYITQTFSDVKADDWFAPYVGYCSRNGIVAGFEDGTFRPEEYVTEKAFLTMLLKVLEYDADRDFNWNSVYQKAYEVGLTEDIERVVSSEDNIQYYRKDVVHSIFLALGKTMDDKNMRLVDYLIDKGVTRQEIIEKYGLYLIDEIETDIVSIKLVEATILEIDFNEEISSLEATDISIKSDDGIIVPVKKIVLNGKVAKVELLEALYSDLEFSLTVKEVKDLDGFVASELLSKFKGMNKPKLESSTFKIQEIDVLDETKIIVSFTQPVTEVAESALNYRFGPTGNLVDGSYTNVKIKRVDGLNDKILVEFKEMQMVSGNQYEFYVRGDLISEYEAYMNLGQGESLSFLGKGTSWDALGVDDVDIIDSYFIEVQFTRPIDEDSGLERSNYDLVNKNTDRTSSPTRVQYKQVNGEVQLDTVMLYFSRMSEDVDYELKIDGVYDVFLDQEMDRTKYEFEGEDNVDYTELDISDAIDKNTIVLEFDRDISKNSEKASIDINHNVEINDIKWFEEEPYKLYLYLDDDDALEEDKKYELEIKSGIEDYLGREIENEEEIVRGPEDYREEIDIEKAIEISPNVIYVEFTDYVDIDDAVNDNLYNLEYRSNDKKKYYEPDSVKAVGNKAVVLVFDSIGTDESLQLNVLRVDDPSGQFSYKELEQNVTRLDE